MDCSRFEQSISDYFDGSLGPPEASQFREHALKCRDCRALMDEVKSALRACNLQDELDPSPILESALLAIPAQRAPLTCNGFEELVTEFLDGFVPAPAYHRFEEHAQQCDECSALLTGVVYAVAACHSVHTFEEVEAPETLIGSLIAIMPERKPSLARRAADRFTALAGSLIPRPTQSARWTFATAVSLAFATFALLLFGFSDDGTVSGIYRQAHVRASELYTQGHDVYAKSDKVVARLESVSRGIGEFWDTLGGDARSGQKNSNAGQSSEKN
ncbi:MAG TPA: zf-HC2 domain-containing protein [Blastocatellia bacterium]